MTGNGTEAARQQRIRDRSRDPLWRKPARRIHSSECIGCDSCMRACPAQFGAVFNHGLDVIIVPELCNGCGLCVQACPVDCIYPEPEPAPTSPQLWRFVEAQEVGRVAP